MGVWERNSTYHRAKQIVRRFLWVVVVLGLLVPLAVHNMRVNHLNNLRNCLLLLQNVKEVLFYRLQSIIVTLILVDTQHNLNIHYKNKTDIKL